MTQGHVNNDCQSDAIQALAQQQNHGVMLKFVTLHTLTSLETILPCVSYAVSLPSLHGYG
jgi:hypothetical protein